MALGLALGAVLGAAACFPDPQGGYDEFIDRTADARIISDAAPEVDVSTGDFSGTYLMGVAVVIDPDPPLMLQVVVTVSGDAPNQTIDFSFQPIRTDITSPDEGSGPRSNARTATGDPIIVNDVPYTDGQFELTLEQIHILGDANPVTYRDITADLTLSGFVTGDTSFCGTITGGVTDPIPLPLDGSTFGSLAAEDPTTIATIPFECSGGGGGTGEGTN